jgi:hypothetical protein
MQIRNPKDFWSGLMFMASGLFFMIWAMTHYQMGTAVRMGPAYFPTVLGGLLAFLGAVIFAESLLARAEGGATQLKMPFDIVDMAIVVAIYGVLGALAHWIGFSSDWVILGGTLIVAVLAVVYRPDAKGLVLITAATVAYGYLMKPLGLIISTAALVFIAAFGGHEFKWREVAILYAILIVFSILVFVKGLTLPFPLCPDFVENCPIR